MTNPDDLAAELTARNVAVVALTWVDNSGITRMKGIPVGRLAHAAQWGVGASPVFDTFLVDDSSVLGQYAGGPVGDLRLVPDLRKLTVLAGQPGWAWAPADRYDQNRDRHPQDARGVLERVVGKLADQGFTVRAGFEVEWCVTPSDSLPAYGMARVVEHSDYLRTLMEALIAENVLVEQLHPEYSPGQFEVSFSPLDPVGAADMLVLVRETIRAVSASFGRRASFAPRVVAGGVGNGGHIHLSLWRDSANLMLSDVGSSFVAGILARLPALLAFGAPSVASYLRLVPSHWAGAYACWGHENREAALRFVTGSPGERESAANIEVKCFDATANPYLALAALLSAGIVGVTDGASLPEPVEVDPASLASPPPRLPTSLSAAADALERDPLFASALGVELVDTVLAVRRGEVAVFDGASEEEIVARTLWRY
ncbi:glutamine synthetase family protein [Hamadaea sp.]|uniref:glutamine synthetase family protein n=1 Tax=Hamadaea sp. TaxID=2024425 RepID=UPI0025C32454|nr:glutamine synthetase family protein [Hamadaea sp.]